MLQADYNLTSFFLYPTVPPHNKRYFFCSISLEIRAVEVICAFQREFSAGAGAAARGWSLQFVLWTAQSAAAARASRTPPGKPHMSFFWREDSQEWQKYKTTFLLLLLRLLTKRPVLIWLLYVASSATRDRTPVGEVLAARCPAWVTAWVTGALSAPDREAVPEGNCAPLPLPKQGIASWALIGKGSCKIQLQLKNSPSS